ncbi:hypothetical protein KCU78_g5868, partial [Aureobasidium melanogenum]
MGYQQVYVMTGACHHPVYACYNQDYTHTHTLWSSVPQYPYGYEQHTLARSVGSTLAQAPIMTSDHTTPAEPVVVDGHNGKGERHRIGPLNERFVIANVSKYKDWKLNYQL